MRSQRISVMTLELIRQVTGRRTDWFRAWATKRRTDEEVNLLYADGRAARRGFHFASGLWKEASRQRDIAPGGKAYAVQKWDMFRQMALDVQNSVASAHLQHTETIQGLGDEDDGLSKVYQLTQAEQRPTDDKLDYSLVSTSVVLRAAPTLTACFSPSDRCWDSGALEKVGIIF